MTVLLVLMIFAIFLTIDFFYSKAKHPALQVAPAKTKQARQPRRVETQHGWAASRFPTTFAITPDTPGR